LYKLSYSIYKLAQQVLRQEGGCGKTLRRKLLLALLLNGLVLFLMNMRKILHIEIGKAL